MTQQTASHRTPPSPPAPPARKPAPDVTPDVTPDDGARVASRRFARRAARLFYGDMGGSGTADLVRFDDDLVTAVMNCVVPDPTHWTCDIAGPLVVLHASMGGDVTCRSGAQEEAAFRRPGLTLAILAARQGLALDFAGGVRQQGIISIFRASTFAARFGLHPEDLSPAVCDALSGAGQQAYVVSVPLDPEVAALIAGTLDSRLDGELRALQCAARLAELLAYTLDSIRRSPTGLEQRQRRRRDADMAHQAFERLSIDYRKPPLFTDLARELGTNPSKLKLVFKEAFGVTMADYCRERRIREAKHLLVGADLTISQIAERVGYEHQSSFTTAFHAEVGVAPREYRQQHVQRPGPQADAR